MPVVDLHHVHAHGFSGFEQRRLRTMAGDVDQAVLDADVDVVGLHARQIHDDQAVSSVLVEVDGGAVNGLCNLGSSLVDGIIGSDGLFARVLNGLSGEDDTAVTSEAAVAQLQQRLEQLEQLIAERRAMLSQQSDLLATREKLTAVAQAISGTTLSTEARKAVLSEVMAFLSQTTVAGQLRTEAPDAGALSTRLDAMLNEHNVPEAERLSVLQQISDVLNDVEEQAAA